MSKKKHKYNYNDILLAKGTGSNDYGDLPRMMLELWELKKEASLEILKELKKLVEGNKK
jgi:hypothetical protein